MSFFFALVSFFVQLIGEISQAPSTLSFLDKRFRRTRERDTWENQVIQEILIKFTFIDS